MPNTITVLDSLGVTQTVVTNDKIDAKIPALGAAVSAASTPVVIASDQSPVPVAATQVDTNISGTISATDVLAGAPAGTGVFIATAPTAGSFVAAAVTGGSAQADIQILGTATGTYYFEASMDSTNGSDGNWIATNYRQTGIINTVLGFAFTTGGLFRGAPSGFKYIRVRNVGGTAPSNAITVRYSNGSGTTFLNASVPSGTNVIGGITLADGSDLVGGSTTDAAAAAGGTGSISAKLRRISSQLVAALGQAVSSASMSVVLASDQMSTTPWNTASRLPVTELDSLAVSGTATSAAVLFTQDMAGYESISVSVTSTGTSCTVTYESSDDNATWFSSTGMSSAVGNGGSPVPFSTTSLMLMFPKRGRWFRARVSTYTSGTVTVVGNLHKSPFSHTTRTYVDGPGTHAGAVTAAVFPINCAAYSTNPTPVANAQQARMISTLLGVAVVRPYSIPEAEWAYAAAASGIVNTTVAVTLVAAQAAGIKNYITAVQLDWDALGAATEVVIRNGAAGPVVWRGKLPTAAGSKIVTLPTPLQSSAATLMEFASLTASVTGGIYVNAQGYYAAD